MVKIDDLLELDKGNIIVKKWSHKLDTARKEIKSMQDELDQLQNTSFQYASKGEQNKEIEDRITSLYYNLDRKQEELDRLTASYEEAHSKFEDMLEQKGIDPSGVFDFDFDVKHKWLGELISNNHISQMAEEPSAYFKKLIQLFGEKELADFSYMIDLDGNGLSYEDMEEETIQEDYDDEIDYSDDYEYDDSDSSEYSGQEYSKVDISHFIFGEEDKIVRTAKTDELRSKLFASKLSFMKSNGIGDIYSCFEEYDEQAKKYNTHDSMFYDEYGFIDYDDTLNNFGILPLSNDRNFYLYILKHKDEMQIPFETLIQYIKGTLMKDADFVSAMEEVNEKGEYSYNPKYAYSPDMLKLLAQKAAEKKQLTEEERKISEAEALIEKQNEGQNIGEE